MYSFQYGGDVLEYFNRYRRELKARADIPAHGGISEADRERVMRQSIFSSKNEPGEPVSDMQVSFL
jgi:hypothetical protein